MRRSTVAAIEGGRQVVALHQAVAISAALTVSLENLMAADPSSDSPELEQLDDHDRSIVEELQRVSK